MARFQNFDEIYSVLYVDFDNIYARLSEQDPVLARTFATAPHRWMRWLEGHALRMMYGDGVRRRVLKRVCYLNPQKYHEFRSFFVRSAFMVVDCPPLTAHGRTCVDIRLVMDCLEDLSHVTRFDEFIILSGDADFTPLLLRIQEHARRTLVLSVGYTAPAYAAACSWRIREDWFIAQALEDQREEGEGEQRFTEAPRAEGREERRNFGQEERRPFEQEERAGRIFGQSVEREHAEATARAERGSSINLPVYKRIRLVESIKQLVAESAVPVPLPSVAQVLQSEQEATTDWFGAGTLKDLLEVLDLAPIVYSPVNQGYVLDPERHTRPADSGRGADFRRAFPKLYDFSLKVHKATNLPLLSPENYARVFALFAEEVAENGFSRSATAKAVEDRCEDEGLDVTGEQLQRIQDAVTRGGAALTGKPAKPGADALSAACLRATQEDCRQNGLELSADDVKLLARWLKNED